MVDIRQSERPVLPTSGARQNVGQSSIVLAVHLVPVKVKLALEV
jgi:hypothetical protein